MSLLLVGICLVVVVGLYFYNNPLGHGSWFMTRRFINWFPLGMTYAFLYMARYNLTVSKNALGSLMSNQDFGWIFGIGTAVYGFSFVVNGPLVDKIGGTRGIIIAAIGSSLANVALGVLTYLVVTGQLKMRLVVAFSAIYAINMYFQSYGAVSIIKVKAYWFHVRERGVFGAIFGTLISFGVYFAFDWGKAIVDMAKANPEGHLNWLHRTIQRVFAVEGKPVDANWAVFYIPAAILLIWALLDWWLIKDTPEEANFPHFDPCDASSGVMHIELTTMDFRALGTAPLPLRHCGRVCRRNRFRQVLSIPPRAPDSDSLRIHVYHGAPHGDLPVLFPVHCRVGILADHHRGDRRPLVDVGHGGSRFWRPKSHGHLLRDC